MAAEEATVPAQKSLCLDLSVSTDEEVGYQTVPVAFAAYRQAVVPPSFSGQFGCFGSQWLVDHSKHGERTAEGGYLREVGTHLTPNDVTGYKSAGVVRSAQCFA